MKTVLASSMVLIVAAISLFTSWYSVTTSRVVSQSESYTTQFEVPTTNYQTVTVYTLPSPVKLHSVNYGPPTPPCSTAWYYCNASAVYKSQTFNLQGGVSYTVTVNECQACDLYIEQQFGSYNTYAWIVGSGETSFVASDSGVYQFYASSGADGGTSPGILNAISITGSVPQIVQLTQTLTTYSTTSVTQSSQTTVPPYIILGVTASATVLVLLALVLLVSILLDRGIVTVSTKHRKRQKQ